MSERTSAEIVTRSKRKPEAMRGQKMTLREYYATRMKLLANTEPAEIDAELLRLFSNAPVDMRRPSASGFLKRHAQELRARVSDLTGQYRYDVDQSLRLMQSRCKELGLRLSRSEQESRVGAAILLTMVTTLTARGRQEFHR